MKRYKKILILIYFELLHFGSMIYSEEIDYANPDSAVLSFDFEFEYADLNHATFNQEHNHILQYYTKRKKNYQNQLNKRLGYKSFKSSQNMNKKGNKIDWNSLYMTNKSIELNKRNKNLRFKR